MSAKSTTQAVRCAYTRLVATGVWWCGCAPAQAEQLRPLLAQAVDRAAAQPLQPPVVSEGIAAMHALVVLWEPGQAEGSAAWTALTHPHKHTLLHDRTIYALTDDGMFHCSLSTPLGPYCNNVGLIFSKIVGIICKYLT